MEARGIFDQLPAADPPSGVTPNFVDPPSLQECAIIVAIVCLVAAGTLLAIRVFTKVFLLKQRYWEDCASSYHLNVLVLADFSPDLSTVAMVSAAQLYQALDANNF